MTASNDTPYRRPNRPGWYGRYTDAQGRRRRHVKIAGEHEGYERAVVRLAELAQQADLIRRGWASPEQFETAERGQASIEDAITRYVTAGRWSDAHRRQVEAVLRSFARPVSARRVGEVMERDVRRYLDATANRCQPATVAKHRTRLAEWFRWCVGERLRVDNPVPRMKLVQSEGGNRGQPSSLSDDELDRLLAASPPDRAMRYLLGARAGLRWWELHRLAWHHIDLEAGYLRLGGIEKVQHHSELPMVPRVRSALADYPRRIGAVFASRPVLSTWYRDLHAAGIIDVRWGPKRGRRGGALRDYNANVAELVGYEREDGSVLNRRCLRKTCGTWLMTRTNDPALVTRLMRHRDSKITMQRYDDRRVRMVHDAQRVADLYERGGA